MPLTDFQNGITSFGVPVIGGGSVPSTAGSYLFVDTDNGSDGNEGTSLAGAFATIGRAITVAGARALVAPTIVIAPGEYDEAVTLTRGTTPANTTLFGMGGRGSVYIAPSTTNATALTNHCDDVTIINVGCEGDGTGNGLTNTGARLRAYNSKFETGTGAAMQLTLGTVAQEAAGTRGTGADCWFFGCETAWADKGVLLTCTDYGAVTQPKFDGCYHHNHSAATFDESVGSGGSAAVLFRNLVIANGVFDDLEDGTAPTAFILLNDDNGNTGLVTQCAFPSAINSGKNLVSTALHWVSNFHTGGVSTGQPS